jgi:hypothetical protein
VTCCDSSHTAVADESDINYTHSRRGERYPYEGP